MRGRDVALGQDTVQPDQTATETSACVKIDHKMLLKQKREEKSATKVILLSICVNYIVIYRTLLRSYVHSYHAYESPKIVLLV